MRKIGLVGTFVRDTIIPWNGKPVQSIGGLFFTAAYLASLADNPVEIYPVSFVGDDFYDELKDELSGYESIKFPGLTRVGQKNTRVRLTYTGPLTREEVTTPPMPPLHTEHLELLRDMDAVIVNLITGFDVDLAALQEFRRHCGSLLLLDIHSRTLGMDASGKRFPRKPGDWVAWFDCADIIQLNEKEAQILGEFSKNSDAAFYEFGEKILQKAATVCLITMGERGSCVLFRNKNGLQREKVMAKKVKEVKDVIGCGDAFQAAFMVHFLEKRDVTEAAEFANKVAAANSTFVGSSKVKNIKTILGEQRL